MGCDIERTIDLPADADAVWEEVIDGSWFGADEFDPSPGGRVHRPDRQGVVEEVDPARRLSFWWTGDDDAPPSFVEITLKPIDDGTRVTVREVLVHADALIAQVARGPLAAARG
jgi:uncharacterized protein YndB with AHSA1/START domain